MATQKSKLNKKDFTGSTHNDDDQRKKFPAGLSSLTALIRQYWVYIEDDKKLGKPISVSKFSKIARVKFIRDRIKNQKLKNITMPDVAGIGQAINKIETQKVDLKYWHLRFLSDYVGVYVAQYLMIAHFISSERRAENEHSDKKKALLGLVSEYELLISEVKSSIEAIENEKDCVFIEHLENDPEKFRPNFHRVASLFQLIRKQRKNNKAVNAKSS